MKLKLLLLITMVCLFSSCTDNQMAKSFGGIMAVNLPPNTEFVNATWKESQLWYIYRSRKPGETTDTITMQEVSEFGLVQGKVQFIEQ